MGLTKKYDYSLKLLKQYNILVVEDCTITANLLEVMLKPYFKTVYICTNGSVAKTIFDKCDVDVILTDIHMPICNGIELIKHIRLHDKDISIIVMTAEDDVISLKKLISLNLSDYILKPIAESELLFRIVNSLQARIKKTYKTIYIRGGAQFDTNTNSVNKDGVRISIAKRELQLLTCLVEHIGSSVSSYDLMAEIWGEDVASTSTLRGLVKTLRSKLGDEAIIAVSNCGYALQAENIIKAL